jgi:hypothetical protein
MSWVGCRSFELMTFLRILSIYLFLLVRMGLGWPPLPRCSSGFDFFRAPTQDMSCFVLPCK